MIIKSLIKCAKRMFNTGVCSVYLIFLQQVVKPQIVKQLGIIKLIRLQCIVDIKFPDSADKTDQ